MTPEISAQQLLQDLCRRDTRYPLQAYEFVYAALGYVQEEMIKKEPAKEGPRHVTGQQLAIGCRDLALQEYGMMASVVLKSWNITETADIGEMVYNLIGIGLMTRTETDRKEDFHNVYDMQKVFAESFQFQLA